MSTFSDIVEKWAISHIDFQHNPSAKATAKEKAFYEIDMINEQNEFVRNHTTAHSPCVAVSSLIDAGLKNSKPQYNKTVYFLMKSTNTMSKTQKQNDRMNASVKYQLDAYILEFLAWLMQYKRKNPNEDGVRGLDFETAEWATIPMAYNGWWVAALEITQTKSLERCLVMSHYIDPS